MNKTKMEKKKKNYYAPVCKAVELMAEARLMLGDASRFPEPLPSKPKDNSTFPWTDDPSTNF